MDLEKSALLGFTKVQQISENYVELREINLGSTNIDTDSINIFITVIWVVLFPRECTEVRFASFLSDGFITMAAINLPERKLAKHVE